MPARVVALVLAFALMPLGLALWLTRADESADVDSWQPRVVVPEDQIRAWQAAWRHVPEAYRGYQKHWPGAATSVIVTLKPAALFVNGRRFYFMHFLPQPEVMPDGRLGVREGIDLFLRPEERCGVVEVLGRAYLGSIWIRLGLVDPAFAAEFPDVKAWAETQWPPLEEPPICG